MREFSQEFLKSLKEKFTRYETYYQVLRITTPKDAITDEIVEEAYKYQINQLNNLFKGFDGEEVNEIKKIIATTLNDAYTALKSKESRKSYEELLNDQKGEER